MKKLLSIAALLLLSVAAFGQANTVTRQFAGAPTGSCSFIMLAIDSTTGNLYNCFNGSWTPSGTTTGTGTVTTLTVGNLSPIFTSSVANASTTPAVTFALSNAAAHTFLGNNTGSSAAPAYSAVNPADISGGNPVFNTVVGQPSTAVTALVGRVTSGGAEYGIEVQNKADNSHIAGIAGTGFFDGTVSGTNISTGTVPAARLPAINLAASGAGGVTGNLPVTNLNSGTSASATTFWRGDGTWSTPSGAGNVTTSVTLTANRLVLGNGSQDLIVLASLGTSSTVLHGNAGGAPSFGSVSLTTDISGNLPVSNLNSGTGASASTFWAGDGTWKAAPGGVSTVFTRTGDVVAVAGDYTLDQITATYSSPLAESSNTLSCPTCTTNASALTANRLVLGGGSNAVSVLGAGTTTTLLHGNAAGAPTFAAVDLANETTGNLAVSHLNSGTGATSSTFWRGDGTWATPSPAGNVTTSVTLTANHLILGNGGVDTIIVASLGTSTTLLHGNAGGAPTFAAVSLSADVTGNLPVANLNSGTGATSSTFWRGDGTWAAAPGGVASVFGRTGAVVATSGDYSLSQITATFSSPLSLSTNTLSCPTCTTNAAALTANRIVIGGGSNAASVLGSLGTTTTLLHGNAAGAPTFGAVSLSADVTGNLPVGNLNSGTSASSATFWRGDGTWATPSGSNPLTTAGSMIVGGVSGSQVELLAPTSVDNVPQILTSTPASGVGGTPLWTVQGISGRNVSGTTDTVLATDRTGWVIVNNATGTAQTLAQPGTAGFAVNFVYGVKNTGAGNTVVTSSSSSIDGQSTLTVPQGHNCMLMSLDSTNYISRCAPGILTAGSNITFTPGANGISIAAGPNVATASGTLTSNAVLIGGGSKAISAISTSTTVTQVLHATAGAPAFSAIVSADLPQINLASTAAGGVTGTLPFTNGGFGIATATSGGIPYFSSATTVASSTQLAANRIVIGGGAATAPTTVSSLGTTTTLLHGNAAGAPTFSAVDLSADVTGNLPVGNLGSGTGASSSTFWRGDGTWATPAGGGTVTNSGNLAANQLVIGGGTTVVSPLGAAGTTSQVLHGNAAGAPSFGAVNLASEVTGNLSVSNLNSGTSASSSTFWRGDGTWATPAGSGNVTGPGSAVADNVTSFNGTSGTIIKDSGIGTADLLRLSTNQTVTGVKTFNGGKLFCGTINAQVGTTYAFVAGDECNLVTFNNASSVAVTISQATTTGFTAGAIFHALNLGAGTVTITPTTSTINGGASIALAQGQSVDIYSDGGNYNATQGGGNVFGPSSATSGNLASYNGTTGKIIQDSSVVAANVVTASSAAGASNQVVISGGANKTISYVSADSTTTHALFATAGAPAFRALATGDLPTALTNQTSIAKVTVTAPATGSTLTIADGKTLTATNTMDVAKTAGTAGSVPYYDTTTSLSADVLTPSAQTDGATVTWAIASVPFANATLTFTTHGGNRTLNITNPVSGGNYILRLVQDGTGGEGLILGTGCTWKVSGGGAGAITLSTGANAIDILAFYYDGTNCYANLNKNFS